MNRVAGLLLAIVSMTALAADPTDSFTRLRSAGPKARSNRMPRHYSASWPTICSMHTPADRLQTKEQYIAAVTKGPARYESFTFSDLKIRLYGPRAAALTAFVDVKMVGQESFRVRTLQVYAENNGQWQMAAHQSTRLGR